MQQFFAEELLLIKRETQIGAFMEIIGSYIFRSLKKKETTSRPISNCIKTSFL